MTSSPVHSVPLTEPSACHSASQPSESPISPDRSSPTLDRLNESEPAPDPIRVSLAIDQALLNHDREFALNKLRSLWTAGWHSVVEELLMLRQEWGFRMAGMEVCDRLSG